ncbi:MAG: serine/threonine protein kinase [Chloroflexota bacterium]|nr:serine/threonine protein kinase [Chloroflexota bacterium]
MQNDSLVGRKLGAYLIQHKLGEGGMARVYKAYHARLRRDVAIKVILPEVADQAGFRERFEREAQVIASLEHRNIVAVYDFGELDELTYLVMQYVGGGTLREQMRGGRPLDARLAASYAIQMAQALHHAHLKGIVHRDVKPQNMLISASDPMLILLSDFGIAKLFDQHTQEASLTTLTTPAAGRMGGGDNLNPTLTSVGQMVGTAEYMAPEQINLKQVDARTDVYALGVVLFQMLTGQVPFQSSTLLGILYQHVHTPPMPVRELNPAVPDGLAQITAKAMAKAPEMRFQSAEAMAQALESVIAPSTNQFSAPLAGPHIAYPQPGSNSLGPGPAQSQGYYASPSYYGGQTLPGAASGGPHSDYGRATTRGGALRTIAAGDNATHAPARPRHTMRFSAIALTLVVIMAVGLTLFSQGRLPWQNNGGHGSVQQATAFNEGFTTNDRNWTSGQMQGLTALVDTQQHRYALTVADGNTYFPHPDTIGSLPGTFTLSATMQQDTSDATAAYGLAFYLTNPGSSVHCYAFIVRIDGEYAVMKYNTDLPTPYSTLWAGSHLPGMHTGLHQANSLQVHVEAGRFTFMVNGTAVTHLVNGASAPLSLKDTMYTSGQPGLLVSGSQVDFVVTAVSLATS